MKVEGEIMDNIGIKRIIALTLVGAFVIFMGYGLLNDKTVPSEFTTMVGSVLGFYFGKGAVNKNEIQK